MARQPFLPNYRGSPTAVGRGTLTIRLAALIGICAESWTHVDLNLALTMGSLLGVENKASVAVFSSLRNSRAQRDALQAAAKSTLTGELLEIFEALLNIHKSLDSQRNDIVHGIWGQSGAIPDGAIWTAAQDHAIMLIEDYHVYAPENSPPENHDRANHIAEDYFVWKYDDIESVILDIQKLSASIANFHAHLRYKSEPAGANALRQLCDEPLLQRELERMRSSGKKTP